MPEKPAIDRWTPDPDNLVELSIWAGAEADYNRWKEVGPVELPPLAEADPFIAQVFVNRARLIFTTALDVLEYRA